MDNLNISVGRTAQSIPLDVKLGFHAISQARFEKNYPLSMQLANAIEEEEFKKYILAKIQYIFSIHYQSALKASKPLPSVVSLISQIPVEHRNVLALANIINNIICLGSITKEPELKNLYLDHAEILTNFLPDSGNKDVKKDIQTQLALYRSNYANPPEARVSCRPVIPLPANESGYSAQTRAPKVTPLSVAPNETHDDLYDDWGYDSYSDAPPEEEKEEEFLRPVRPGAANENDYYSEESRANRDTLSPFDPDEWNDYLSYPEDSGSDSSSNASSPYRGSPSPLIISIPLKTP